MKKGISIILCCYNSESRLPKTLEYLAKQEIDKDIPVELIIVNNASTDHTNEVAQGEWKQYDSRFRFRMLDEDKQGLIFARRRGVHEAQYEYILFCDDDNWLQPDYAQKAFDLMESNARIGALGGQSIVATDIDLPEWFSDFEAGYAVGKQAAESGDVSKRGWIWGAGLVSRKNILAKALSQKHPFLNQGRTGIILTSGDDCEICKRILLLGFELHYEKSLLLHHYLPPNRLTWAYKKDLFEGFESSNAILEKYDDVINVLRKSKFRKISGILKYMLLASVSNNRTYKIRLSIKTGLMFKTEKTIKDTEYRNIVKFCFQ